MVCRLCTSSMRAQFPVNANDADESHRYIACDPSDARATVNCIYSCPADIQAWMTNDSEMLVGFIQGNSRIVLEIFNIMLLFEKRFS